MPSQIKVDQITDSSGTLPVDCPNGVTTTELVAGSMVSNTWKNSDGTENYKCRAWVNFDGTTTPPTIRASGNVSSVTRNSTGLFTINFTTTMIDSNYVCNPSSVFTDAGATYGMRMSVGNASASNVYTGISSTSCSVVNKNEAGTLINPVGVFVNFFR